MKKIICVLIISFAFVANVKAFSIDINTLNISNKSENLIEEHFNSYKIETEGFEKNTDYNEDVIEITNTLVDIALEESTAQEKNQKFTKYMYIDSSNGFSSLSSKMFIETFVKEIDGKKIEIDYIKNIRTVEFEEGVISFVYLPNTNVDGVLQDMVLAFWLKQDSSGYKLHFPWMNLGEDLEKYFNEVTNNEDSGNNIGGTFKSISLASNKVDVDNTKLNYIYENTKNSVVQVSGIGVNGVNVYGSGFFLRKGIVVTSWSLFSQILNYSQNMYVNDSHGESYRISGIVSANVDYDVVVLKLDTEIGLGVKFGDSNDLKLDDKLFMVNSKNNSNFIINYGTFVSEKNGKLENLFLLNSADVGAALFDEKCNVIGFNTNEALYSELSYANSSNYLIKLQEMLINQEFDNIVSKSFESFKESYYIDVAEEKKVINVDSKEWSKFKSIGDLENSIPLPLIKSNYENKILSLRYKNDIKDSIGTMYLVSNYVDNLEKEGFKIVLDKTNKIILKNKDYKIVLKTNLDYLIVLIMEN